MRGSEVQPKKSIFSCYGEVWTFVTSIVMGITMVMGVSALTSAPGYMTDYYKYARGDEAAEAENPKFWKSVLTFYVVVTMVTQTIFEPVNLTTFCCRFSLNFRLYASCLLMLVELLVVLLIPVFSSASEKGGIAALILMAFVGGVARAFYENTGYALFGPFPARMISGFVIGAAVSGVLTSILEIIIKASMPDDYVSVKKQAHIYFSVALGIIVLTMLLLFILSKNSYALKHVAEFRSRRGFFANIYKKNKNVVARAGPESDETGDMIVGSTGKDVVEGAEEEDVPTTAELLQSIKVWPIIKKIYPMQFSCFFTYFLTYLLFPGVMLVVDDVDAWYGTIVMAVFNAADLTGRLLCLVPTFWLPRRWVVIGSLTRILLVPLLVLCAKTIIPTHGAAYAITAVTGMTNGYFATMSVTYAPLSEGILSDGEKALAGQATGVCLLFGVSMGSLLQLAIVLAL